MTGTVLVTGASRGLGLATAVAFAEAGHRVFATMRNPAKAPEALESRTNIEVLRLDVTDPTTVDAGTAGDVDA